MIVSRIADFSEFSSLAVEWSSLLKRSGKANIFLSHEWLLSWMEVYGCNVELYVLTCRDEINNNLVGVFPLYRICEGFIKNNKILRFVADDHVGSDYLEPLVLEDRCEEIYTVFFEYLFKNKKEWDLIKISSADSDSKFSIFLRNSKFQNKVFSENLNVSPYLKLPDSWEKFTTSLSSKFQKKIGYSRRALERVCPYAVCCVDSFDGVHSALDDLIKIRRDRLQSIGVDFDKVSVSYRKFHEKVMSRFFRNGWLKLCFLNIEEIAVAYAYQFVFGKRVFFYQTGFSREWSARSVGFVMLGHMIQDSIRESNVSFEFLRGGEDYKYNWNISGSVFLVDVVIFSGNNNVIVYKIKNSLLCCARYIIFVAKRMISNIKNLRRGMF